MKSRKNKRYSCFFIAALLTALFTTAFSVSANAADNSSGEFAADSYRFAANQMVSSGEQQYDVAIASFNNGISGESRLFSFYLSGKDIKNLAELDASYSYKEEPVTLCFSGLVYEYNDKRPKLDKVYEIYTAPSMLEKSKASIDDDTMYRVAADDMSIAIINKLKGHSHGFISFSMDGINKAATIKDAAGSDMTAANAYELYLNSFSGADTSYESLDGRKIRVSSFAPSMYLKNSSTHFCIVTISIIVLIIIAVIIIRIIVYNKHKKKVFIK